MIPNPSSPANHMLIKALRVIQGAPGLNWLNLVILYSNALLLKWATFLRFKWGLRPNLPAWRHAQKASSRSPQWLYLGKDTADSKGELLPFLSPRWLWQSHSRLRGSRVTVVLCVPPGVSTFHIGMSLQIFRSVTVHLIEERPPNQPVSRMTRDTETRVKLLHNNNKHKHRSLFVCCAVCLIS